MLATDGAEYRLWPVRGLRRMRRGLSQFFEMRDDKAWVINADRFSENPDKGILLICPYYAITIE
jgi:hypothetical protein